MAVTVSLRFQIIDQEAFDQATNTLVEEMVLVEPASLEDRVAAVVTNTDVFALKNGDYVGWVDLGLERVA